MNTVQDFKNRVNVLRNEEFHGLAMELFRFQAVNNPVYSAYLSNLEVDITTINQFDDIPCLPIQFFKYHEIKTGSWSTKELFMSSGTTGMKRSVHHMDELDFYRNHSWRVFGQFFPHFSRFDVVLALLPSYQSQGNSSLICMVDHIMSKVSESQYCLEDMTELTAKIHRLLKKGLNVYLFGVGYALLDLAEYSTHRLDGLKIIETGGMKGRRAELTKTEYYDLLKKGLGDVQIYSEYGMTELLSQAYAFGEDDYRCPVNMKVIVKDHTDPFASSSYNKTGVINVIDLANVHSCAFIETQDLGKVKENGHFQVLGRLDNSDVRGCNLLVQ